MPHLHTCTEHAFELTHELAEIHTLFCREENREFFTIELPFGVRHFHLKPLGADFFDGAFSYVIFVVAQLFGADDFFRVGYP